jgi:hypothetical protein
MTKCGDLIYSKLENTLGIDKSDVERIVAAVNRVVEDGTLTTKQKMDAIESAIQSSIHASELKLRNTYLDLVTVSQAKQRIAKFKDPNDGIMALLVGKNNVDGGRLSVESHQKAIEAEYLTGGLLYRLEKDKLLSFFNDKNNSLDILKELLDIENPNGGKSRNEQARRIAAIIREIESDLITRINETGGWIDNRPGKIFSNLHNSGKMEVAGFEKWASDAAQLYDLTEVSDSDKLPVLRELYERITTGVGFKNDILDEVDELKGVSTFVKRLNRTEAIDFISTDAMHTYIETYGDGNIQNALFAGIHRKSKAIGLLETFGSDPEKNFKKIISELVETNRENHSVVSKLLSQDTKGVLTGVTPENVFKNLIGTSLSAVNPSVAQVSQLLRTWATVTSLGGSLLAQVPDLAVKASVLRQHGKPLLSAYAAGISDIFSGLGHSERKLFAKAAGFGFDGFLSSVSGRFNSEDGVPGTANKLTAAFFKFTGMNFWTDSQKTGLSLTFMNLAAESGSDFAKINPGLQSIYREYELDSVWKDVHDARVKVENGFLIDSTKIKNKEAKQKWLQYLHDQADFGVMTPGAVEASIINRGTRAGTVEGEMLRFIGQFKSFSVGMLSKVLPRLMETGSTHTKITAVANLFVGGTILGYTSMVLKSIAAGKTPPSPERPDTWVQAMSAGGGAGLYADFILNDYSRHGETLAESIAGPVLGKSQRLVRTTYKALNDLAKEGEGDGNDIVGAGKSLIPFINLFYTKSALDYFIFKGLQEFFEPGSLAKTEENLYNRTGQEYLPDVLEEVTPPIIPF